jgi:hypothetical protein
MIKLSSIAAKGHIASLAHTLNDAPRCGHGALVGITPPRNQLGDPRLRAASDCRDHLHDLQHHLV